VIHQRGGILKGALEDVVSFSMAVTEVRSSGATPTAEGERDARSLPAPRVVLLVVLVVFGVLCRLAWSWRNGASFDESFTAMMGRQPIGTMLTSLRTNDSHPPLDYLLRAPLAGAGVSTLVLRIPSLLFSCAALVLFAWWMRGRGIAGSVAVAVMAVSPFQIMYGSEARMYALLELLGVGAAVVAEAWWRKPRQWHSVALGGIVLLALFDHVSGFLLAGGLVALGGVRRDREAWRLRAALAAAVAIWAVTWGPSFVTQSSTPHASWIQHTTVDSFVSTMASFVTNQPGVGPIIAVVMVVGIARLWTADRVLGRVVVCCALLPIFAAALIGLVTPFFIDRTVTITAWAPCLAIGFTVEAAWCRTFVVRAIAAVLVAVLIVPATVEFLQRHWEYDAAASHLTSVSRAGDVVATVPGWYGPLVDWRVGVQGFGAMHPTTVSAIPAAHAVLLGHAGATGRAWVLSFAGDRRRFAELPHCAPDWTDGVTTVSCLEVGKVS
jgi:hypothetical protein